MAVKLKLHEVLKNEEIESIVIEEIKKGSIFIYPTDTVYGIGCDATNKEAVSKIRRMKGSKHPFSVIAPNKKWITKNLVVLHEEYLKKLPGPYTLIFKKKKSRFLRAASELNSLGVRIPNHPLTKIIQASGKPFITTSVNLSGEKQIHGINEIPKEIKPDIIVDAGRLEGKPSKVVDLTREKVVILRK